MIYTMHDLIVALTVMVIKVVKPFACVLLQFACNNIEELLHR